MELSIILGVSIIVFIAALINKLIHRKSLQRLNLIAFITILISLYGINGNVMVIHLACTSNEVTSLLGHYSVVLLIGAILSIGISVKQIIE